MKTTSDFSDCNSPKPFYKKGTCGENRLNLESVKRPIQFRFLYFFLFAGFMIFLYSFNFEVSLLDILSKSSMVDETNNLSTLEKISIKKQADKIYQEYGLGTRFLITDDELTIPSNIPPRRLFFSINPSSNDNLSFFPTQIPRYVQARFDENVSACIQETKRIGKCMENALSFLYETLKTNNIEKLDTPIAIF